MMNEDWVLEWIDCLSVLIVVVNKVNMELH